MVFKAARELSTEASNISSIPTLLQILRFPTSPSDRPNASEWQSVEEKLGMQLPEDYKEFITHYGTGAIDGFLWVLNPFSRNKYLNFFDQGQVKIDALRGLCQEAIPYPLHPDPNGMLPWGVTDNADVLFWCCNGPPSHWWIVVNEDRGPRWREYKLSTSDFLARLTTRRLVVDIFPEDFPSESPEFIPAH